MNTEEKAKAYDEALKTATQWIKDGCSDKEKICLESIFPELRESEDEKVKERAIAILKQQRDYWSYDGPANKFPPSTKRKDLVEAIDVALAYLEKQKEQKPRWEINNPHTTKWTKEMIDEKFEELVEEYHKQKPVVTHGETYHVDTLGTQQVIAGKMPQNPAEWSEEDSDNLERVDNYLWMLDDYVGDDCATPQGKADKIRENIQKVLSPWLKSLPERFNLQPKQEWSEEDSNMICEIIDHCITIPYIGGTLRLNDERKKELKTFVKSLRPQPHWKPSEEQIYSLGTIVKGYDECAVGSVGYNLKEMYEQLKKL